MSSLDMYKIPREKVDVEAIAQGMARYLKMTAEDAEYLSYDPTRRDAIMAELYKQPDVKPSSWPNQFVADGQDPDEYFGPANAALDELTPPKSFEERVTRLHIAFAASMVYRQFKIDYALADHWDLGDKVRARWHAILNEYKVTEFARLFPDRVKAVRDKGRNATGRKAMATPPRRPSPLTPPATRHGGKSKTITTDDIGEFLQSPHTLLGKNFRHSPPPNVVQDYKGKWEVASYSARMGEDGVDHEFQIMLDAFDRVLLPMDREDVQFLLTHSTLVD